MAKRLQSSLAMEGTAGSALRCLRLLKGRLPLLAGRRVARFEADDLVLVLAHGTTQFPLAWSPSASTRASSAFAMVAALAT